MFVWTRIDNGKPTGRNGLVKLAIHLLSIIANSAGCERAFSDFGIIHTKPCNKLSAEKVHKTGVVKMELRRTHVEAGLTHTRRKRAFGEIDSPEEPPQSTDSPAVHADESDPDFRAVAQALVASATAAADADSDSPSDDPTEPPPSRPQNAHPTQYQPIPLKLLFDYPVAATMHEGVGLDFYWKGGLRNLDRELASYDLQQAEDDEDEGVAGGEVETGGGNATASAS